MGHPFLILFLLNLLFYINLTFFWRNYVENRKTASKIVGTITLWQISEVDKTAEIGFELLPENQGLGIMQEVIPKVIEFGFNNLKLVEIIGEVAPDNAKSVALLKKYGFKLKSKLKNTQLYALTQN